LRRWMIRLYFSQRLGPKHPAALPHPIAEITLGGRPLPLVGAGVLATRSPNLLLAGVVLALFTAILLASFAVLTDNKRFIAFPPSTPHDAPVRLDPTTHARPRHQPTPGCWPPTLGWAIHTRVLLARLLVAVASRARTADPSLQLLSSWERRTMALTGPTSAMRSGGAAFLGESLGQLRANH
jgi:hypothetical protein